MWKKLISATKTLKQKTLSKSLDTIWEAYGGTCVYVQGGQLLMLKGHPNFTGSLFSSWNKELLL